MDGDCLPQCDPPWFYRGPKQHTIVALAQFSSSSPPPPPHPPTQKKKKKKRGCRSHDLKNRGRSEQAVKHVSWTGQPRDFESWLACPCQQVPYVNPTITLQSARDYSVSAPSSTLFIFMYIRGPAGSNKTQMLILTYEFWILILSYLTRKHTCTVHVKMHQHHLLH